MCQLKYEGVSPRERPHLGSFPTFYGLGSRGVDQPSKPTIDLQRSIGLEESRRLLASL